MGISILIPVYNFPVDNLVHSLVAQLADSGKEAEIIVLDDGSAPGSSGDLTTISRLPHLRVHTNQVNEGRMAARNRLASLAKHDYLLFLDGDSEIVKDDFMSSYFTEVENGTSLASGGRVYQEYPPKDCSKRLHWKYGSKRESSTNRHGHAFMSNNFLVKKEIFLGLDQSLLLKSYGHEDSWWGIQFEQKSINSKTIDNPVLHASLEDSDTFLKKAESALENIMVLRESAGEETIKKHIRIYRVYRKLKSLGLASVFSFFEKPFHKMFRRNLLSCHPKLFYFDCYRLAELIRRERG